MIAHEFKRLGDPDAVRHANALADRIDVAQRQANADRLRDTIECEIGQTTTSPEECW